MCTGTRQRVHHRSSQCHREASGGVPATLLTARRAFGARVARNVCNFVLGKRLDANQSITRRTHSDQFIKLRLNSNSIPVLRVLKVIPPLTSPDRSVATIVESRLGELFGVTFECGSVQPIASKLISSVWIN